MTERTSRSSAAAAAGKGVLADCSELEASVEATIETLRRLEVTLDVLQPDTEANYYELVQTLVDRFGDVAKHKDDCPDEIPTAIIFDYIDQGRNPELYTRARLEMAQEAHQRRAGQLAAISNFKSILQTNISKRSGRRHSDPGAGAGGAGGMA